MSDDNLEEIDQIKKKQKVDQTATVQQKQLINQGGVPQLILPLLQVHLQTQLQTQPQPQQPAQQAPQSPQSPIIAPVVAPAEIKEPPIQASLEKKEANTKAKKEETQVAADKKPEPKVESHLTQHILNFNGLEVPAHLNAHIPSRMEKVDQKSMMGKSFPAIPEFPSSPKSPSEQSQ